MTATAVPAPVGALDIPTLEDLPDPAGCRVLVRADLEVPAKGDSLLSRTRRLWQLQPTLHWLAARGARVTICGHRGDLGRPGDPVAYAATVDAVRQLWPAVEVGPNLSSEENEPSGGDMLASLIADHDQYVNEAFQWSWLPLASLVEPPARLPAAAGRRLRQDLELLGAFLVAPERPFVAVLGGEQSLGRLHGLRGLILRADAVLVGGEMSLPFLQALGRQPDDGASSPFIEECRRAYGLARELLHTVQVPDDLVWEHPDGSTAISRADVSVPGIVTDIGPRTRVRYGEIVEGAGSILWTGALGKAEDPRFAAGSLAVAQALAGRRSRTVLGGDALLDLLAAHGLIGPASTVVSATDSAVALLKDGDLPGLAALRRGRPSA